MTKCIDISVISYGMWYHIYAMVAGISHDIAFGMCHVGCKSISYYHVLCLLAMWYVLTMYCFLITTEKINL